MKQFFTFFFTVLGMFTYGQNTGTILYEQWANSGGTSLNTNIFNTAPTTSYGLNLFEGPYNNSDNYSGRIRGYVHAPQTGNYIFWISSDDASELWLSTDDNPLNKVKIAEVSFWTNYHEWTKMPSQQSVQISLQAGQRYYIEALHIESTSGDNLAVRWQLPDASFEAPIPGNRLSPYIVEQGQDSSLIFNTGLTRTGNIVRNNLITGIPGGQTITGGTGGSNNLVLRSTSNEGKGKIIFGSSVFDESSNRLGINVSNPSQALSVDGHAWITGSIYAGGISNFTISEYGKLQLLNGGARILRSIPDNGAAFEAYQEHVASTGNIFQWRNSSGLKGVISQAGKMGIGVIAPTAYLHLKAGESGVGQAPVKFTPGVNLSTPENNALEWDGSRLFQTTNTGTRNAIAYLSDINSNTDLSNYIDKTTDQNIAGVKTFSSPVNISINDGVLLTKAGQPLLTSAYGGLSLGSGTPFAYGGMVFLGDSAGVNAGGWGGNIGIGMNSLRDNQQGHNVAIGPNALRHNNNYNSIAIGVNAGLNAAGSHLIAIGPDALNGNLNGSNIGIGRATLASASSGGGNIAIGAYSGSGVVGHNNVIIGASAAGNLGNSNIVIGTSSALSASANNQINIGNVIYGTGVTGGVNPSATARVGIGTLAPSTTLEVVGTMKASGAVTLSNLSGSGTRMVVADGAGNLSTQTVPTGGSGVSSWNDLSDKPTTIAGFGITDAAVNANVVHTTGNESIAGVKTFSNNIGIGTTDPGVYQLAVKGTIRTQAIKVDPSGWADDVFSKSYKLPALKDVESFIKEKQHLPDIPSESEVKKNGIELGEMNALLLKKIEELTLYMIEKDKQLENANQKIDDLARKVETLENKQ